MQIRLDCVTSAQLTSGGGKVICVPVALPASTLSNTPAEGNQRFHLRTVDAKIPYVVSFKVVKMLSFDLGWFSSHFRAPLYVSSSLCYNIHRVSKKNFSFLFCQNFVKFPPILISFGRWVVKCLKLYAVYALPPHLTNVKFLPNTGFITTILLRFG